MIPKFFCWLVLMLLYAVRCWLICCFFEFLPVWCCHCAGWFFLKKFSWQCHSKRSESSICCHSVHHHAGAASCCHRRRWLFNYFRRHRSLQATASAIVHYLQPCQPASPCCAVSCPLGPVDFLTPFAHCRKQLQQGRYCPLPDTVSLCSHTGIASCRFRLIILLSLPAGNSPLAPQHYHLVCRAAADSFCCYP